MTITSSGPTQINAVTTGFQIAGDLQRLPDGRFAVAYESRSSITNPVTSGLLGSTYTVRYLDANGAPTGAEVTASLTGIPANAEGYPLWRALSDGTLLAVYEMWVPNQSGTGGTLSVNAQLFNQQGARIGSPITVYTSNTFNAELTDVDALPGGGFSIIVTTFNPTPDVMRVYGNSGSLVQSVTLPSMTNTNNQIVKLDEVVWLSGGSYVAADVLPNTIGGTPATIQNAAVDLVVRFSSQGANQVTRLTPQNLASNERVRDSEVAQIVATPDGGVMIALINEIVQPLPSGGWQPLRMEGQLIKVMPGGATTQLANWVMSTDPLASDIWIPSMVVRSDGSVVLTSELYDFSGSQSQVRAYSSNGALIGTLDLGFAGGIDGNATLMTRSDGSVMVTYSGRPGATGDFEIYSQILTIGSPVPPNTATEFNDTLNGTAGDDVIYALGGDDSVIGQAGNDYLDGGNGNDTLIGNDGQDTLVGGAGNDVLISFSGVDLLIGGDGDDLYFIDEVGDVVVEQPNGGFDTISSSAEFSFIFSPNVEALVLQDGTAARVGWGNAQSNILTGNSADNVLIGGDGNDMISGGGGADVLLGDAGADTLNGDAGDDVLWAGDGNDVLNGGDGADILIGGTGADTMAGGAGDDNYFIDNAGDVVTEAANAGNDVAWVFTSNVPTIANVETIVLVGGATQITAGSGNDVLIANGALASNLNGGGGNDVLWGSMLGDTLTGGTGSDALAGLGGADIFVFSGAGFGFDVINDFSGTLGGQGDKIQLSGLGVSAFGQLNIQQLGQGTLVSFGTDAILLWNILATNLRSDDFVFA